MKKLLIALAILALVPAAASAIPLTEEYLIGTVMPGSPAGDQDELARLEYFVLLYNGGTPVAPDDNAYNLDPGGALPTPLPYPVIWGTRIQGEELTGNLFTPPGDYSYLLAKFGQNSAYYYIGDLSGELELQAPAAFGTTGVGLSHISLFNPSSSVPEPATMLLFGMGLLGIGAVERRRRR